MMPLVFHISAGAPNSGFSNCLSLVLVSIASGMPCVHLEAVIKVITSVAAVVRSALSIPMVRMLHHLFNDRSIPFSVGSMQEEFLSTLKPIIAAARADSEQLGGFVQQW